MAETNHTYILEQTYDRSGWVAANATGDMIISWDNMEFMKTIHVMFSNSPENGDVKAQQLVEMETFVEWLSEYHFEKMYKD